MKKVFLIMLLMLSCIFFSTACGKNDTGMQDILSGTIVIDGDEYDIDNLHSQLIDAGWVMDDYSLMTLESDNESIVSYQHEDYGLDLMDFKIEVFYVNSTDEDISILDGEIVTVLISRRNVSEYPSFGFKNGINLSKTKDEINGICKASVDGDNQLEYNGSSDTKVQNVILSFDDEEVLETIELTLK